MGYNSSPVQPSSSEKAVIQRALQLGFLSSQQAQEAWQRSLGKSGLPTPFLATLRESYLTPQQLPELERIYGLALAAQTSIFLGEENSTVIQDREERLQDTSDRGQAPRDSSRLGETVALDAPLGLQDPESPPCASP